MEPLVNAEDPHAKPDIEAQGSHAKAAVHTRLRDAFLAEAAEHERIANRYSLLRLISFIGGVCALGAGFVHHAQGELLCGSLLLAAFFVGVVLHARTISRKEGALLRQEIHARHLLRLSGEWVKLESRGDGLLPREHAYAWDVDLLGRASLFQRIDVTHTHDGEQTLAGWLGSAAQREVIAERQAAVAELASLLPLRQELEAAAAGGWERKLDPRGVDKLTRLPSLFAEKPWLRALSLVAPVITLSSLALGAWGVWPSTLWLVPASGQAVLLAWLGARTRRSFDMLDAKLPVFESFERMLLVLENARWQSSLLKTLQARVAFDGVPASMHVRRLARWAGLAQLRTNVLFHVLINNLTLWDLHVLFGLERFVRDVGSRASDWFLSLGELEALASLATLADGDTDASFPEVVDAREPFVAVQLGHPLLVPEVRVRNDLQLRGPGTALVVTGSNMAGKSTLLRAVGQNLALALAGGPVIAKHLRVPHVRLRASMRAEDSLESGTSYFHAELEKLKRVIDEAEAQPPVFFLLDELLRGTNARARHIGAKAVLFHLLARSGTGLVATHDTELAALGAEQPTRIDNVHFTDVIFDGEMRFDYKLRPGIVRTSNALRLLAMAGIDVPQAERRAVEEAEPDAPSVSAGSASSVLGAGSANKEAR